MSQGSKRSSEVAKRQRQKRGLESPLLPSGRKNTQDKGLPRAWLSPECLSGKTTPVWPPSPLALMWGDPTVQVNGGFEERKLHAVCFLPMLHSLQSVSPIWRLIFALQTGLEIQTWEMIYPRLLLGSVLEHSISALLTGFYAKHSHCRGMQNNGVFPKKSLWWGDQSGKRRDGSEGAPFPSAICPSKGCQGLFWVKGKNGPTGNHTSKQVISTCSSILGLSPPFLHCTAVALELAESAWNRLAGNDENCHFPLSAQ